ncbi:MAG: SURF1 family protein [Anaerolineae bacterium]
MPELLSGRWWLKHILVLIVLIVLISLGLWQLRRLEERRALNQNIQTALSQPALSLRDAQIDPEMLHFRRVTVTGIFDNAAAIVLRNQLMDDNPGVHLITPLRLTGSEQVILIDRGWIPRREADLQPTDLTPYEITGEVTIEGIAYRTQTRSGWLSPLDPPLREGQTRLVNWFRVDIDRIQQQVPYPLLPVFIKQLPDSSTQPDTLPQPEALTLDEGPHLGYALQWFSFATILVVTYGLFLRQQVGKSNQAQ